VAYYFHPGKDDASSSMDESDEPSGPMPIVFVHGIGLGLLPYMPLIDALLKTGRPLLLPEVRCVEYYLVVSFNHLSRCMFACGRFRTFPGSDRSNLPMPSCPPPWSVRPCWPFWLRMVSYEPSIWVIPTAHRGCPTCANTPNRPWPVFYSSTPFVFVCTSHT
jgi:hypothetical protein